MINIALRHTLLKIVRKSRAYRGIRMVAVEADVLCGVRPLFSFPEKQLPHSFVHSTEEVLEGPWSFRIKHPHTERPSLPRQNLADKHYLDHVDKTDVLLKEALDAAL